jgi:hypothetical protein
MAKRIICLVLSLGLYATSLPASAQGSSYQQPTGPKRQLATIIFAGLGGAVLGLSTLSFYGRPQDKLNNIAVGFAIGVISGTIYTTYQTATRPRSYYSKFESEALTEFELNNDRLAALTSKSFVPVLYEYSF